MAANHAMKVRIIIPDAAATQLNFPAFRRLAQFRAGIAVDDPDSGLLAALWAFAFPEVHIFQKRYSSVYQSAHSCRADSSACLACSINGSGANEKKRSLLPMSWVKASIDSCRA